MKKGIFNLLKRALILALALFTLLPVCVTWAAAEEEKFSISDNLATECDAIVNNHWASGAPKTRAIDGDDNSYWRTLTSCNDNFVYLILVFKKETDVNLIQILPYELQNMTSIKLQYTTDPAPSANSEWVDIKTYAKSEITPTITAGFDTVTATGVRFYADITAHSVGLYEMKVHYANDVDAGLDALINGYSNQEFIEFSQPDYVDAQIVSVGANGELIYKDTEGDGSKFIDYSYAGYKNGEEPIPDVKVVKTIDANYRDNHTTLIQNAINEVAALPLEQRGAILLKAGTYTITETIKITAAGIVLRGEGQGENGTIIYDARTKDATSVSINGGGTYIPVPNTKATVTKDYTPAGIEELKLSDVSAYKVGDNVGVTCTPNNLWVQTLGMDVIPGAKPWNPTEFAMTYERWITAVDTAKNTITLNTGIPLTLDSQYYSAYVQKIEDNKNRITECGVENIRFVAYYNGNKNDESHPNKAIWLQDCRNCWVKDVTSQYYGFSTVYAGGGTINLTVDGCSYLDPISIVDGGRRYSFVIVGAQYVLIKNCYSYDSRHDYVLQSRNCGPNVFLDSVANDSNNGSEPHHRWSTGTLYDNIYETGQQRLGYLLCINAGDNGGSHGWMGAHTIFWNCLSPAILVGKPQTEQNFAIGAYGIYDITTAEKETYIKKRYYKFTTPTIVTPGYPATKAFEGSPMHGTGYIESAYNPVNPSSLYKAQLSYRLYGDATKNVIPGAPILNYPLYDSKSVSSSVTFSGICDINADKVFVYVDGVQHEAEFAGDGNAYSLTLSLENGYHDISVTQKINGIESAHNATRTILVDSKTPYVPPVEDPKDNETTEPTETTDLNVGTGDNTGDSEKSNNLVLPLVIIAVCVVACVVVFFVVKKTKKSK